MLPIVTAEDIFTRMNIDYKFLCNSSSVGGNENRQDKSSLVGDDDIENCQNKDVGIENHLSSDSVDGMKNHLLNAGCLFTMHFQLTYFPPRQDILKRTLSHYKACFHYQAE